MYSRTTQRPSGYLGGLGGPPVPDVLAIVIVLFVTFAMQFFPATAVIPASLALSPTTVVPFLWQLVTYPLVGWGRPDLWFLLELLVLYWFAADVFRRLGRARFWRLLLIGSACCAVVATAVFLGLTRLLDLTSIPLVSPLIQGQRVLLTITTAAFALLYSDATVLLFFVLPMPARYFLWFPILLGLVAFLPTKDLPGLVGIGVAVLVTWALLRHARRPGSGRWWSHLKELWRRSRIRRLRRRSGLRGVDPGSGRPDLTIN